VRLPQRDEEKDRGGRAEGKRSASVVKTLNFARGMGDQLKLMNKRNRKEARTKPSYALKEDVPLRRAKHGLAMGQSRSIKDTRRGGGSTETFSEGVVKKFSFYHKARREGGTHAGKGLRFTKGRAKPALGGRKKGENCWTGEPSNNVPRKG